MARQLDPDFRIRTVRPSYSPSNRPARPQARQPATIMPIARVTTRATKSKKLKPHHYWFRYPGITVIFVLFAIMGVFIFRNPLLDKQAGTPANAQVAGASTTNTTAIPPIDQAQLTAKINQILNSYSNLDTGVSVVGLRDGGVYDFGDDAAYYAASVSKLISASDFLKHVESGDYNLDTLIAGSPAKIQLEKLIVDSDNDAWQGFIDLLGHPELEHFAKTYEVSFNADENTLNAHDTASFIHKLYQNKILNRSNTKLLLGYMNRASTDQYLETNAPTGAVVYQKAGWLKDRLHVAGVVTNGNTGYAVAIFSKVNGTYDYLVGAKLIQQIQAILNETYF